MFRKFVKMVQGMKTVESKFDPAQFGDPVAMKTDWGPAKGGGTNFRTHKLVEVNQDRLEFKAAAGAKLFYLIFFLAGIGLMIGFIFSGYSSEGFSFNTTLIMLPLIGLVFTLVGGCLMYFGTAPVVFDKRMGSFWKGRKAPSMVLRRTSLKHFTELDKIHALQIISEYCRSTCSNRMYFSVYGLESCITPRLP